MVLVVPSHLECPGDLEVHEAQWSQWRPGSPFSTLLVGLGRGARR